MLYFLNKSRNYTFNYAVFNVFYPSMYIDTNRLVFLYDIFNDTIRFCQGFSTMCFGYNTICIGAHRT